MIERNRNLTGRISCMIFGLCGLVDGIVRILSLGFYHTTLSLDYSRESTRRYFQKKKLEQSSK